MKILLDECLDENLRHYFGAHHCQTCRYANFRGLTNGNLLNAAEQAGFEILITVDQNMPYQQRMEGRTISLVVLATRTMKIEDLAILVPKVLAALENLMPGSVVRLEATR